MDKLGVSAQTASRWHRIFLAEGKKGLAGAGRAGRLPKLSDEQLAQVEQALLKGPRAHGFATQMWTLARVADVIEALTGIRYGQTQTWTILRLRLGWSRQRVWFTRPGIIGSIAAARSRPSQRLPTTTTGARLSMLSRTASDSPTSRSSPFPAATVSDPDRRRTR